MKSSNWSFVYTLAAIVGVLAGYVITLVLEPGLLPPQLRLGCLSQPTTILLLGTDVVYARTAGHDVPQASSLMGRSDTIMVAHLDPIRNRLAVLSIPRDTLVPIPGHGLQKINAANAFGGPYLAQRTVSDFLGIPIDHYMVLNLEGFVQLVQELGGVTVEVPYRMRYLDWSAKLNIDLVPGLHRLNGNQAMGFVRFRHSALGDIGRVQRQEIFLKAILLRALEPDAWSHLPSLIGIAHQYVCTDMSEPFLLSVITFARAVPPENQCMVLLPGNFAVDNSGSWVTTNYNVSRVVSKITGSIDQSSSGVALPISIENDSQDRQLGHKLSRFLQSLGYSIIGDTQAAVRGSHRYTTRIVAQRANPEDAAKLKSALGGTGEIVNASIGNIESAITIMAGDDLLPLLNHR